MTLLPATIIHPLYTSRIDNGNFLLTGITDRLLFNFTSFSSHKMLRILTKTSKFGPITLILKDPHWLPIRERINFKILLLTWKALNGTTSEYLFILLLPFIPSRTLRQGSRKCGSRGAALLGNGRPNLRK